MQYVSSFSGCSIKDVEDSKTFYHDVLGLEIEDSMGGIALVLPEGGRHYLYQKDDHKPAVYTVLNLMVESIDDAILELSERGASFRHYDNLPAPQDELGVLRGKDAGYGPNIAWLEDPSGNIIGILEN